MGCCAIYKRSATNRYYYYSRGFFTWFMHAWKANYAFAPLHGELGATYNHLQPHIVKTDAIGIYAAEEIVNKSLQIIHSSLPTS